MLEVGKGLRQIGIAHAEGIGMSKRLFVPEIRKG